MFCNFPMQNEEFQAQFLVWVISQHCGELTVHTANIIYKIFIYSSSNTFFVMVKNYIGDNKSMILNHHKQ